MANEVTYGFVGLEHLMAERVTTIGVGRVYRAIEESAADHTRQVNALMASMVRRTTEHQRRIYLPGTGTLQPLDQYGNPQPVRPSGYYDVAFPIQGGGTAFADNRVSRAYLTIEDVNRSVLAAIQADSDWMRRHILGAMFTNTTWTYEDAQFGNLTVQPLANGDAVVYVKQGLGAQTDTHYLAQLAAIADASNPFETIYDELMEHPSNRGPVVVYVPSNLTASIEALSSFVEVNDPDILYGVTSDTIRAQALEGIRGHGDEVLGKVDKCWIVEWRALPSDYMLAHARGSTVLAMREHVPTELQGFFPENNSPDGNLQETRMLRYAGFGVEDRIAALVMRIGDGAYAIPADYTAPLAA